MPKVHKFILTLVCGTVGRRQTEGARRHLGHTFLLALAIALGAASVAGAHDAQRGRSGAVLTPSQGKLVGEGWAQLYSLPISENPFFGNGSPCLTVGHHAIEMVEGGSCTITQGTAILLQLGSAYSNVEDPFPPDEASQRAVALASDQAVSEIHVTVDDDEPVDIRTPRFELFSPQRTVQLPADNVLGVPAQTVTLTAHAWSTLVRNLRPGSHTIVVDGLVWNGQHATYPHFVTVVRGGHQ
jgi:hypothetical protein